MEIISKEQPKKRLSWEKSQGLNGVTKRVRVEQAENGFIVTIETYGRDETKEDSKYMDECKKYISASNPLEELEPKEEEQQQEQKNPSKDILGAIKELFC